MIWSIPSLANWVLVSLRNWNNVNLNLNFASNFLLASLSIFSSQFEPESLRLVKLQRLEFLGFKHTVIVRLIESNWLLDKRAIFDQLLEVQAGLSNHIIALEEITVISLQSELVVFSWHLEAVDESVLEVRLTVLVPVMTVSLLHILFGVKESTEEHITCAFPVHDLHFDSIEDADSDFKCFWRLIRDVVELEVAWINHCGIDFQPAFEDTLLLRAGRMVDLAVLHRFLRQTLPFETEVSILKVDMCRTDQIISKNVIVVPNIDLEWRATREHAFKIIVLVELWIWLI